MLRHEDLIRGIGRAGLERSVMELGHAVDAGDEHHQDGPGHSREHDWAPPSLEPIQGHDHQLPQRGLEEEGQYQNHFGPDHGIEQLYHSLW